MQFNIPLLSHSQMHTQNDVKCSNIQNQGSVTTAPSGPLTDSPAGDAGRAVRHTLFCLLFMPLAGKPLTKPHVTGTHALCSQRCVPAPAVSEGTVPAL